MSRLKKPLMRKLKFRPILTTGILSALYVMAPAMLRLPAANSQQTTSSQTDHSPALKSETNLVLVRVVVRDSQGHPVTGLRKEDFKLFDRGKEQPISQFDEVPGAESAATQQPSDRQTDRQQTSPQAAPISSGPARLVAFYFDDLNAPQASLMQARDAAEKFIATNLQPGDKVSIFSSEKMLTDFTADTAKINQAIAQLNGSSRPGQAVRRCPDLSVYQAEELLRNGDYLHNPAWQLASAEYKQCTGRDPDPKIPPDVHLIGAMAQALVGEAQARTRANLQQFEQVTRYIAHLPGQRTIVLVSPGFLSSEEQYRLDRIIDEALRSQVVINALDPKGLAILMREQDPSRRTIATTEGALISSYTIDSAQAAESGEVLTELTQGTGGRFFHNNNDLAAGFASLAGHPDEYTLAFSPKDLKRDGKFHELKVTLVIKQKGGTVSARRGYFATEDVGANAELPETAVITPVPQASMSAETSTATPQGLPQSQQMDDSVRQALLATTDSTDLPIRMDLTTGADSHEISVLIHLDARALPFRKEGDRSLDTVTIAAAIFDAGDKAGLIKQRSAKLDLTPEQLSSIDAKGIELTFTFALEPGAHRIRAVVTESEQHKIGSLSRILSTN
ncbi:MAG TPA: VWA domain-containing protein [Edaphobacter sp.]|nr:VWA domain-containing protein [Edaphobacter sp.]